ncbi:hypothetical protein FDZ71_16085, partial [bacterium]
MNFLIRRKNRIINIVPFPVAFFIVGSPDRHFTVARTIFDDVALASLAPISMPTCAGAEEDISARMDTGAKRYLKAMVTKGEVRGGDTMDIILRRAGASTQRAQAFLGAVRPNIDPRQMKVGNQYTFWTAPDGEILRFEYKKGPTEFIRADLTGQSWKFRKISVPIERVEATLSGSLEGSLWNSFIEAGADPDLIMGFTDLFAWDIDFAHESQPGDEFRVVYERLYVNGKFIGNGKIKAASYKDREETHWAFYYGGATSGYYDIKGNNIRKSFLRSPLDFTRVTSNFSYSRRHPVTNQVKAHLGVDFGAPSGTPVKSVADGTVTMAGYNGAAGKM